MLRLSQAAHQFGVSTRTLERWIHSGEVKPTLRTLGGHVRFSIEDIERYKAMFREKHEPKPFDWEGEAARMEALGDQAPWRIRRTPRGNYSMSPNWGPTPEELKRQKAEKAAEAKLKRAARCVAFLARRFGMTRKQFRTAVQSEPLTTVAQRFRMSDQALRKTCRRYGIGTRRRGYWAKRRAKGRVKH